MRIDSIESFLTLAETLNYTEAADRLYITQSALSRSILQMEEELGITLFTRSRRGVELTPAGESFFLDAEKMMELYSEGIARAKTAYKGEHGRISIACHRTVVEPGLFDIVESFSKEKKDIALDFVSMTTSEIILALDSGTVDCAVTSGLPRTEGIEKILIHPYPECLVVSKSHPMANLETVSIKDLRNESFAVMSRSFSSRGHDNVIGLTRDAGFSPHIEAEADSVPHLLLLLSQGKLVTILSENYKYMAYDRFSFIPLSEQDVTNLAFVYNKNNSNPCLMQLTKFVKDRFQYKLPPA